MEENEITAEYFEKVQELVNAMRACKNGITDQLVLDKILRTLPQRFDHLVVTIEQTQDLDSMDLEDLQHSLEITSAKLTREKGFKNYLFKQELVINKGVKRLVRRQIES